MIWEHNFLAPLSNKKYINYIDDIVTDYDQLYFDACIFNELIRIKNKFNPQQCFDYRWAIPLDNPYKAKGKKRKTTCPQELTAEDEQQIEQIWVASQLAFDDFVNEQDPDGNFLDLVMVAEGLCDNDAKGTISGLGGPSFSVNLDALITETLARNELIAEFDQFPTLLLFEDFTSTTSTVAGYRGCVNTVSARQKVNARIRFKSDPDTRYSIVYTVTANFIRRSSDDVDEPRWKAASFAVAAKENGIIPDEPAPPQTTADMSGGLQCHASSNNTDVDYRERILMGMLD